MAETETPAVQDAVDPQSLISVFEMLGSLLVVVALILFLGWALRRLSFAGSSNGALKVVSSLPLGQKQQLILVQAGDKQLLLGVTPGSVNLVKEFDQPIIEPQQTTAKNISGQFSQQLAQVLSKKVVKENG